MVAEIKPTAELVGHNPQYKQGAEYVLGARPAPAPARGQRQEGPGPPRDHPHALRARPRQDGRGRAEDLRPGGQALPRRSSIRRRRSSARGWRPRWRSTCSAPAAGACVEAGWKAVYGERGRARGAGEDDSGGDQLLPKLEQGEDVETRSVESMRKETQPPRRFTEASLLGAMETAGKEIDDAELREAMKDSGIGTPATRASIIERLVSVGYIEREGRALVATEKGDPGDPPARRAPAHLARAHRRLGAPPRADRAAARTPARRSCATSRCSPPTRSRSSTSSRA